MFRAGVLLGVMRFSVVLAGSASFLLVSCGPKHRGPDFPRPEALQKIAEAPAPAPEGAVVADVDTWKLTGPVRDTVDAERHHGSTPWDALLDAALPANPSASAPEAMHCLARELGAFELGNHGEPSADLLAFMAARCGAATAAVESQSFPYDAEAAVPESELLADVREKLSAELQALAASGSDIGIWFGRSKTRGVITVVAAKPDVVVEPVSMIPDAEGKVHLRGHVTFAASSIGGIVNQGRVGFAPCVAEPIAPPSFDITCATLAGDDEAWIEIDATPAGHVLAHSVLTLFALPGHRSINVYSRPRLGASKVAPVPGVAQGFLAGLNELREAAGLAPVHEVKEESETATRLAPYYFSSLRSAHPETAETIALGMMAGWQVDVPVRYGKMTSGWTAQSSDPRRVLSSYVERPSGRSVLLDPDVSLIGVGVVEVPGKSALGTIVASWAQLHIETQDTRVAKVLSHIAKLRMEKKLPPPRRINSPADVQFTADLVEVKHKSAKRALNELMTRTANRMREGVRGLRIETGSLDDFTISDDLLTTPNLDLVVCVAWARAPGEPWGRYVIFLVNAAGVPA